jgi:hypothetical protein
MISREPYPSHLSDREWRAIQRQRDRKLTDALRQHLDDCIDTFKALQYLQRDSRGRAISTAAKLKALYDPAFKLLSALKQMDWDTEMETFKPSSSVTLRHLPWMPAPGDVFELFEMLELNLTTLVEVIQIAEIRSVKTKAKKRTGPNPANFVSLVQKWDALLRRFDEGEAVEKDVWTIAKVAARVTGKEIKPATIKRAVKAIAGARGQASQPQSSSGAARDGATAK